MTTITSSVCIRCGKQRIVLSSKKELVGTSTIVVLETICPDPDCQSKVSKILDEEHKRRAQSEALKLGRANARRGIKLSN